MPLPPFVETVVIPAEMGKLYRLQGWWKDEHLGAHLYESFTSRPHGRARFLRSSGEVQEVSFGSLIRAAVEIGCQLRLDEPCSGDELIVVYGANTPETCAALIGACLSGLTVLPIATHVPISEAREWATSLGADVVLNCTGNAPELANERHTDVQVPAGMSTADARELPNSLRQKWLERSPDDSSIVGLTAGSTGKPKAVIHSHNSILAESSQLCKAAPSDYPEVLIATPIAHAIGWLGGIMMPLYFGHDIHLMEVWNPRRAHTYMRSERVSCGGGVPSLCESLIGDKDFTEDDWSIMRVAGFGGAPTKDALAEELHEHGVFVYRSFGSTEHPSVTHSGGLDYPARLRSEGSVLPGAQIRLVNEDGSRVVDEGEGFIQTRGPDLCIGIIDEDHETWQHVGDGWFASGDFGRLDDCGVLWDVARVDDVVKSHGRLVNLGRIEALLRSADASHDFAVVPVPSKTVAIDTELVLCTTDASADLRELRERLRSAGVTPSELPAAIKVVARIPTTALGKIDRQAMRLTVSSEEAAPH